GYLYVFQVDSSGNTQWLFPKNQHCSFSSGINPVEAAQIVLIPPAGSQRALHLDEVAGAEQVYAVLADTHWQELEKALARVIPRASPSEPLAEATPAKVPAVSERLSVPLDLRLRGAAGTHELKTPIGFEVNRNTYMNDLTGKVIESLGVVVIERSFKH